MRKYRGVPRTINPKPAPVPKEQPFTERPLPPAPQTTSEPKPLAKNIASFRLQPFYDKSGRAILFDIFEDEAWCGSRRTLSQFARLMESIGGADRS